MQKFLKVLAYQIQQYLKRITCHNRVGFSHKVDPVFKNVCPYMSDKTHRHYSTNNEPQGIFDVLQLNRNQSYYGLLFRK